MAPITLNVTTRSGKVVLREFETDDSLTVDDLQAAFHAKNKKYYPSRQRFEVPVPGARRGTPLASGKKLSDYALEPKDGAVLLHFKDLGPQIGYSTVFFWEYFGPMVVYPLFYFLPGLFYSADSIAKGSPATFVQSLACGYWVFHYAKRILETFLVHKFSHGTMPIFNLFKNCGYYWTFAAWCSYFINHPLFTPPVNEVQTYACLGLAMVCQFSNAYCHIILANLRPPGSKEYRIPKGFLFNYITCANYTMEISGWILFTAATHCLSAGVFTFAGAYQMALWAIAKHKRLRRQFDGKDGRPKYPRRWVMLPPFL